MCSASSGTANTYKKSRIKILGIRTRLFVGFMSIAALGALAGLLGIRAGRLVVREMAEDEAHLHENCEQAAQIGSCTAGAKGHLLVHLAIGTRTDRNEFFTRCQALRDLIKELDGKIADRRSKDVLAGIAPRTGELLKLGSRLIEARDAAIAEAGSFDPSQQTATLAKFDRVARNVVNDGRQLAREFARAEASARNSAIAGAMDAQKYIALTIAGAVILAIFLGYISSRNIAGTITRLRRASAKLGDGDLDVRMASGGRGELGELADTFNAMANSVQQAEESLIYERHLLASLMESTPDSIYFKDADSRFIRASRAQSERFGLSDPGEAMGRSDFDFFTHEHAQKARADEQEVMKTGQPLIAQAEHLAFPDGREMWVLSTKMPFRNPAGEIVGTFGISRDITELTLAQEALKTSLEEKEVLLREVHHRVKNNLQVISSLLSLQARGTASGDTRRVLDEIQNRVRSMSLIHDTLSAGQSISEIRFDDYINRLVTHLGITYRRDAGGIETVLDIPQVALSIDTAMICGLILNELVSNAMEHAFPEAPSGRIEIRMTRDEGQYVMSVRDNGVGIPPEVDLDSPATLGLQLVEALAGQLGGELEFDVQQGTEVRISFPRASTS